MKNKKVFIIAEAGVNHNGSLEIAKRLIDEAVKAGADAVKFQTFTAETLVTKNALKARYQTETTCKNENQYKMLKKLELDEDKHRILKKYCEQNNIIFVSSPFSVENIEFLANMDMDIFKIPSGELTNLPYLRKIGSLGRKVILSTGMADLKEIKDALDVLVKAGTKLENVIILHCNTEYPTPMQDVNLKAMQTIGRSLGVCVGYSDHTLGIEVPIAAVALGASVIEKHFTLNRSMKGPDHKASLEPQEFKAMVSAIRNIEKAMGDGIKKPSPSEAKNLPIVRKSIVAGKNIKKGEVFTEDNITIKRPGNGIDPMMWDEVVGKIAKKDFILDEKIEI